MYRCAACDTPPEYGHRSECPMTDPIMQNLPEQEEEKINVASGEDAYVELEFV